ncbi:MAG: GNAT family N-acetyltransferase [Spirochaetales bacterium]|nr:GNAT family N-acetyltransferase [Spirochaetales bacterium]
MVTIELLKETDINTILEWNKNRSVDFLLQWAGNGYSFPLTEEQILTKIVHKGEINDTHNIIFKIKEVSGNMIGTVELSKINRKKKQAWVSRFLIGDERNRNRGYGSEALREVICFAYDKLDVEDLFLRVFDFNVNAIKCYEKAGFKRIETVEKVRKTAGGFWNVYVMERKM